METLTSFEFKNYIFIYKTMEKKKKIEMKKRKSFILLRIMPYPYLNTHCIEKRQRK